MLASVGLPRGEGRPTIPLRDSIFRGFDDPEGFTLSVHPWGPAGELCARIGDQGACEGVHRQCRLVGRDLRGGRPSPVRSASRAQGAAAWRAWGPPRIPTNSPPGPTATDVEVREEADSAAGPGLDLRVTWLYLAETLGPLFSLALRRRIPNRGRRWGAFLRFPAIVDPRSGLNRLL